MQRPFSTGFMIFPGFPMACLTSMIEPLRAANEISDTKAFEWVLISETLDRVDASALVAFEPGKTLDQIRDLDLLILLSGPNAQFKSDSSAAKLRSLQRHGTAVGAVSGGVFPLVRAELAKGKPLAVHWCYKAAFDTDFPEQNSSDQVIEISESLLTAAGAAAAFDLSLHIIKQKLGNGIATEVACWFQHPVIRNTGVSQAVPSLSTGDTGDALSPLISRAVRILTENLSEPVGIGELADQLGITARHLERSFKQSTGLSPTHYYRKLRMDAARQMVRYTNERLGEIAAAVGYGSLQTFSKHYQSAFDVTPKQDRNRINLFRVKGNLSVPSV
ncbi:GlxA family transcriptional regulator [Thalassococcus lentus]|uniref:Helix-turn-helix domain-containing protein n=1 Tax=Thalassococcus lentus TaxID=1210524 RepID=A0ABT4XSH0_9RHOB|nr:helix-turn-helix domain-containing protein [Thalassococcus lentus]MDA7424891.1 helix-turn-helix domain-containing protein [Thalassococcus lentus]